MAKTEFDARLVARNQRTNRIIDDVMRKAPTKADKNMVDRVVRPYMHILNECEIHDVDPDKIYDATTSAASTMLTEMLVRTMPKDNPTMLQGVVQTVLEEFTEAFLKSVAVNFGVEFETAPAAPPAPPKVLQ